jgi:hypothetical protein
MRSLDAFHKTADQRCPSVRIYAPQGILVVEVDASGN